MRSTFVTLAALETPVVALLMLGALATGAIGGVMVARVMATRTMARQTDEARASADRITADARTEAERIKLENERHILDRKTEVDQEIEAMRKEARELERRLAKREDLVDRKEEAMTLKEQTLSKQAESLRQRDAAIAEKQKQVDALLEQQQRKLLDIAGVSRPEALDMVLKRVEEESRLEVAKISRRIVEDAETEARERSREVIVNAVQRYATEHTSETTVRTVAIPSDDVKGRIIGREGRNIRTFEQAAGVNIIVDDTPGVIVVSCFDKIRQAVAVEALERLIADGRMHPARIEEVIAKVRGEVNEKMLKAGRDAGLEVSLRGLHPKIIEAMGKLHYRTSYGQNVLRHSIEVAFLSQIIADQLGLDGTLARRCGFLHDIGKAMDQEMEGGHPKIGMDFARQHGEKEPVLNAIGGHHADIPATSFYTPIVMAADAVSSARPGARRESMERYVQRLEALQDIALGFQGVTEAYAIQAGREVRVMVDAAKISDDEAHYIAQQIAKRVSEQMTFPGEIRVTVLRETRAIEIAR